MPVVFKSKAGADLLMVNTHARQLLALLEKGEPGILTVEQMPDALTRLERAVANEEALLASAAAEAQARGLPPPERPEVLLRQRWEPWMRLLRLSQAAGVPVVWGV